MVGVVLSMVRVVPSMVGVVPIQWSIMLHVWCGLLKQIHLPLSSSLTLPTIGGWMTSPHPPGSFMLFELPSLVTTGRATASRLRTPTRSRRDRAPLVSLVEIEGQRVKCPQVRRPQRVQPVSFCDVHAKYPSYPVCAPTLVPQCTTSPPLQSAPDNQC